MLIKILNDYINFYGLQLLILVISFIMNKRKIRSLVACLIYAVVCISFVYFLGLTTDVNEILNKIDSDFPPYEFMHIIFCYIGAFILHIILALISRYANLD